MIGVPDSSLKDWLKGNYIVATDEGEAIGFAAGVYLATGKPETVFMGSNGFANALDAFTSLIMPYKIPINLVIGIRTDTEWHEVMGHEIHNILSDLDYDDSTVHIKFI